MVRVASYGRPYPKITESVIPEAAQNKEPYLHKTYEGVFKLEYSPRMPTPREAVMALSYALDQFEAEHPGTWIRYAEIDHPTALELRAGSVPTCRFQFVTEHHSPFPIIVLLLGAMTILAAWMAKVAAVTVLFWVTVVWLAIAVGDFIVTHWLRAPTLKCVKCDKDLNYLGIEGFKAHWRAEHADQEEPDWEKMQKEYEAAQKGIAHTIKWGLIGLGGVLVAYIAYKEVGARYRGKGKS